jgi:hypothetical protein
MKTAIIFSEGIKQINFTPENDDEKLALKLITTDDNIELAIKEGSFGEHRYKPFSIDVNTCRGGYLRAFDGDNSIMFVLRPKQAKTTPILATTISLTPEEIATEFTERKLSKVSTLVGEDFKKGFKEGIEKYLSENKNE